jgi:hypothetical protein
MSPEVDLQSTLSSLRRQAEALADLQRRCARLRELPERPHAQLGALTVAIDAVIDECLVIAERAAEADPGGAWKSAIAELERQLRRLGVLRADLLAMYVVGGQTRTRATPPP